MFKFSPEISELALSMQNNTYVRERAKGSILSNSELTEYGLVCASMIARVAINYIQLTDSSYHHDKIVSFAIRLGHIIGEQDDTTSNKILEQIFGREFTQCRELGHKVSSSQKSTYSEDWYPRRATKLDRLKAEQTDYQLTLRGATYLHSEKGQILLQSPSIASAGCPLLRLPRYEGDNPFDSLITLFVNYYTNSTQNKSVYGPATSSLETIINLESTSKRKRFRYDWTIPNSIAIHDGAE